MKNLLIGAILLLNLTYGQIVIQDSVETIKPSLTIYSYPENATVYANDSLLGTTPLNIQELKEGSNKIIVKIDSSKKMEYDFNFPLKENLIVHSVLEKEYGYYTFATDPAGARVFLNDSLWGVTPLKVKIPIGKYSLKYELDEYSDFDMLLNITPVKFDHFRKMEPKYSILNIENKEAINRIFIDDVEFDINDFNDVKMNSELTNRTKTNIKVELADKITMKDEDIRFKAGNSYSIKVTDNKQSMYPLLKSVLIPGWGQMDEGAKTKGIFILSGYVLSGALTTFSFINYNKKEDEYKKAKEDYINAKDVMTAVKTREIMKESYNSLDRATIYKNVSIGIMAGVYLYNLLDVVIFHSSIKDLEVVQSKSNLSITTDFSKINMKYSF